MSRIVILGAGTAGTIMANRLRRRYASEVARGATQITVIDQDDQHVYQPGLLFIPFGIYHPDEIVRSRRAQLHDKVEYVAAVVQRLHPESQEVELSDGERIPYDACIIASGTRIAPDETEGLTGPGWRTKMFDFYTLEGATALANAFANWGGGRLVINVVEMPIKCPVAPLEFAFLADWFFTMRGIRDRVDITYATPLDGAFTKPICTRALSYLLDEKHVHLLTEFNAGRVDGEAGVLASWDEREVPFDILVSIPLHQGADFVKHTPGLGDDAGFVKTDHHTLQSKLSPSIFAIGDATNVPASKAGSVAHFEGEILEENIARFLEGLPPEPAFDGHANCFIETGFDKALLIDFNYDTEPLPGKFPFARIGPMSLLSESKVNHLGKMAFKWIYWNLLLPGHDMPGIKPQMTMTGKEPPAEFAGR
ncbi:MAG TPA: FAD/NAD(P)-binding oxidoreductase [Gemmatimonadaceae bacterium]|nr:MAG: oxidoreductase [Gemmatimonadetes bacterium SCN 70-22]HMN09404.1 FAD/NAD(P)-binding oxidoreductase [Gemmatimonadaceae bacterium]